MFTVTESGSGVCWNGWEERIMWVIWEITHISFSQTPAPMWIRFSHLEDEGSTFLRNFEHAPTKWCRNPKENYQLINNHCENMKNYIAGTCTMEGWVGSISNVDMLMERKIPACGKSKTLESQPILLAELQWIKNGMTIADIWKLLWPSVIKKCKLWQSKNQTLETCMFLSVYRRFQWQCNKAYTGIVLCCFMQTCQWHQWFKKKHIWKSVEQMTKYVC